MNTSSTSDRVQQLICFRIAAHKQAQATQRGYRAVNLVKLASPSNDPLTLVSLRSLQQQSQSTLTTCTPTRSHQGYHALFNPHTLETLVRHCDLLTYSHACSFICNSSLFSATILWGDYEGTMKVLWGDYEGNMRGLWGHYKGTIRGL